MKRATITLSDDIQQALVAYQQDQDRAPTITAVVQIALRHYLAERGYLPPTQSLRISPAPFGSGMRDASSRHDQYFSNLCHERS